MNDDSGTTTERVFVLGHSHTNALSMALADAPNDIFQIVNINTLEDKTLVKSEALSQLANPTRVVSMVGGNAYYQVALLEHPQPIQVLAGPDDTEIDPNRSIIAHGMMRDFLTIACRSHFQVIESIQGAFDVPIIHVISPPPLAAENLSDILPPAYRDRDSAGIVPPLLRLKIYQIQSTIIHEFCESRAIPVMDPPAPALDDQGFLKDEYRSFTATHAGKNYGALVIDQIMEWVNG